MSPAAARPLRWAIVGLRSGYYFIYRVLVCEPFFKSYCTTLGRRVRTGVYIHWIDGTGRLEIGDDVKVDGRCSITFAARFCEWPTLEIGSGTTVSHNCTFVIGKEVRIGRNCEIASDVWIFDSSGHPIDPAARRAGEPPRSDDVKPVRISDNVWIGSRSIVFPGVTIGEGSVVSAASVVTSDVPPFTMVAGNPARRVSALHADPVIQT